MTKQIYQQGITERITRRWWFYLLFVVLQFIIPPYASKGYKFPEEWGNVCLQAISNPIVSLSKYNAVFKVIPVLLTISIIIIPRRASRFFGVYMAVSYILFALRPGIGETEKYGLVINGHWIIVSFIVAAFWFWEVIVNKNDFTVRKQALWKYWVAPLALLAFWYPLNRQTGLPDFNPVYLFTNGAGLAFCTMTPLYIGILTIYYPKVNLITLRVTSLVGLITAVNNMHLNFIAYPKTLWWNGVLHIPLLVISLYGLILSLKRPPIAEQTGDCN